MEAICNSQQTSLEMFTEKHTKPNEFCVPYQMTQMASQEHSELFTSLQSIRVQYMMNLNEMHFGLLSVMVGRMVFNNLPSTIG